MVLWPPGLQTLSSIAIGVESGTWLDGEEGRDDKYHPVVLARLLNLPGLDSIYFRAIDENSDFPVEHEYKFVEGCSPVRQIFLDEISYNDPGFWMRTMKACKNELTHVALRASSLLDVESTIGHAQNIIPQVQSVMLYAPEPWNSSYYRLEELDGYYPTDGKSGLRQISTTIEDIIFKYR
ncbi:hypothetical protein TI39_contig4101g00033 [Zymoseptoria brevis]|uniref:Uncharacterized protein n=1 Tax=Zymoseptoria brevis TaxID=1047168 RepID=A0A0F4GDV5_9PEZI|nr:hypothetical protein TI39_contig4101g00033 [Zymoseptoria brevis]